MGARCCDHQGCSRWARQFVAEGAPGNALKPLSDGPNYRYAITEAVSVAHICCGSRHCRGAGEPVR